MNLANRNPAARFDSEGQPNTDHPLFPFGAMQPQHARAMAIAFAVAHTADDVHTALRFERRARLLDGGGTGHLHGYLDGDWFFDWRERFEALRDVAQAFLDRAVSS